MQYNLCEVLRYKAVLSTLEKENNGLAMRLATMSFSCLGLAVTESIVNLH